MLKAIPDIVTLTADNQTISYSATGSQNVNYTVFRINNNSEYYTSSKLWGLKVFNSSDQLVRNFVPASKVENNETVVGLYDTVSGQFFRDAAGGNFIAGPSCVNPNLFDKNNTTVLNLGASTGYGAYATNSERYGVAVKVEPNTTYTWSFNRGSQTVYINFVESVNYPTNGESYSSYVGIGNSASTYTFTTKSTTNYVYFYTTDTSFVNTMQLEQGSTATEYRPYGENICD